MSRDKKKTPAKLHPDHPMPVTRRQFLASGLLSFSAYSIAPVFFSMLKSRRAMAAGRGLVSATRDPSLIPFLVFDCAGGAGLPGNFLVGNQKGPDDLLASYDTLGWNPRSDALDRSFGVPMAKTVSMIYKGITTAASSGAQAGLRMGTICTASQDDSSGNPLSALCLVLNAGYQGKYLVKGLGDQNSDSGGNSETALGQASQKPIYIGSVDDIKTAVSFGGALGTLSPSQLLALASSSADLNSLLIPKYQASGDDGKRLAGMASAAYANNKGLIGSPPSVDPRTDPVLSQIYNINSSTDPTSTDAISAVMVLNVLNGNTGPGVITIGGCDYHNQGQAATDAKDLEIGTAVGRAVETAFQMKSPLFFQILTDGGVSATTGTREWQSDSGDRGLMVIGYFNPTAAPQMSHFQVGHYTDGQGVDRSTFIGNNPATSAFAAFANYLNICKKISEFESIVGQGTFTVDQMNQVLMFS